MAASQPSPAALNDAQQERLESLLDELEPLVEAGAYNQAVARLDEAIEALPAEGDDAFLRGALLTRRAELHLDFDMPAEALDDARQALKLGWRDAETHGLAGWAHLSLESFDEARRMFEEALRYSPDDVSLLTGYAMVLRELDEPEKARAELTHAIHVDSSDPELYAMRSEVHLAMSDLDTAERDIRQARELDPEEPEYALGHARLLLVQGNTDEALEVIDDAVDEADGTLEALLLRSHLRLMAGRAKEAFADAMRASNRYPDEAFAFVQLAHVQLAEGNVNLATKAAERAVKLDPSLADGYLVRGAALHMKGDADAAREDFERASQAPAELPMFLLGPAFEFLEAGGFNASILELLNQTGFGGFDAESAQEAFKHVGAGGLGGLDPMQMLGQLFDEGGNIRGPFKSFFEMAFKNAPKIMRTMPPELLSQLGGFDPSQLEELDMSNLSPEQIEEQMRQFYRMMQSGENPFAGFGPGPSDKDDDTGDDES